MLKFSTTTLALLGSVSGLDMSKTERVKKSMLGYSGINKAAKHGKAIDTQGANIHSATSGTAGNWFTIDSSNDCSVDPPAVREGYRMGECVENVDGSGPSSFYSTYSCMEDASSGEVMLSEMRYNDAACAIGGAAQSPITLSSTCTDGFKYHCPIMSDYKSVKDEYSAGGLMQSGFHSTTDCSGDDEADVIAYAGAKGCSDGAYWGEDSAVFYASEDCTGFFFFTFDYDDTTMHDMFCNTVDDDGYDDDDDDYMSYDNMKVSGLWGVAKPPMAVEFGKWTTAAYRAGKKRWVGDESIEHGECDGFRFNTVGIKSLIQSPSADSFNTIVELSHPKRQMHMGRSYVNVTVRDTNDNDHQFNRRLFEDSDIITHFDFPTVNAEGMVVGSDDNFRFLLSIDFEEHSIPTSMDNVVDVEVSSFRVNGRGEWVLDAIDCATLNDVGIAATPAA